MRFVYCPHGNSDKGYSQKEGIPKDISLVYGSHMRDLLREKYPIDSLIEVGNYRLSYYRQNQKFYDALVRQTVSIDPQKKTLLYAPSWEDGENSTSFFEVCAKFIETTEKDFNLLIKLHPFLLEYQIGKTMRIMALYEERAHFLIDFPPVYPLLHLADAYMGDFSSIAYDFLSFDKPLYFFKVGNLPIHRCGMLLPQEIPLGKFVKETLEKNTLSFREKRQQLYTYAFGKEKNRKELLAEIAAKCLQ